jgi:hypothetical protein
MCLSLRPPRFHCCPAEFDWESKDCLYMGTVDYSSVRSLYGYHPCGWDDLEALAVTLLEMATGEALACMDAGIEWTRRNNHGCLNTCTCVA